MKIPKRFKLHEVAEIDDTNIYVLDIGEEYLALVTSSSNGIAIIPVTSDTTVELPCIAWDEKSDGIVISSEAIKEAVKGKTGTGEIIFRSKHMTVRSAEEKNQILMKYPETDDSPANAKVIEKIKKHLVQKSPDKYHYAEVCLDAELLATLCRAIGTSKVRLRFLVNSATKIADGKHSNLIQITPYRKDGDGEEAILSMLVTNK